MNRKQIAGMVIAALVFVFISVSSAITNNYVQTGLLNTFASNTRSYYPVNEAYVGVVDISGTILEDSASPIFSSVEEYNHQVTLDCIDEMMYSYNNRGILLYLDSPGGGVYESDEVYLKLKQYREETNRPIYVYMSREACSGAYYIAMASDRQVYANRNAWTGSIGVVISMLNTKGLYDKIGIREIDITSGRNKTIGSQGSELTDEQAAILQSLVDEAYEQFVDIVAEGRGMDARQVKELADGRIYSAKQAWEHGLIDGIMTLEGLKDYIYEESSEYITICDPDKQESLIQQLVHNIQSVGRKSDAQVLQELIEKRGNGVLMYHADQFRQ